MLLCVATFALCLAVGWGLWKLTGLRKFDLDIATAAPPPSDHFLAHDRGGHVDHHVLFHGMDEEAVRLDLRYVENWSLSLDLLILWKTARAVLGGSGAY